MKLRRYITNGKCLKATFWPQSEEKWSPNVQQMWLLACRNESVVTFRSLGLSDSRVLGVWIQGPAKWLLTATLTTYVYFSIQLWSPQLPPKHTVLKLPCHVLGCVQRQTRATRSLSELCLFPQHSNNWLPVCVSLSCCLRTVVFLSLQPSKPLHAIFILTTPTFSLILKLPGKPYNIGMVDNEQWALSNEQEKCGR